MEFVILDPKTAGSGRSFTDVDTQRKVRIHVMKDFRKRQRDGPSSLTPRTSARHLRPAAVVCREVRSYDAPTPLDSSQGSYTRCGNRRKPQSHARRGCYSSSELQVSDTTTISLRSIHRAPNAWPSLSSNGFSSSPSELDQSIALAITYYQCKVPGLTADQAFITLNAVANNQRAFSDTAGHHTSLATLDASAYKGTIKLHLSATCLASIGCMLSERSMRTAGGLHHLFKSIVLQGIVARLNDTSTAISRATLGALFGLTTFEIACGSPEAFVHLRGIARILDIMGEEVQYEGYGGGLRKVLEFIDLLHAVKTGLEPVYTASWSVLDSKAPQYDSVSVVPATDRGPAYQWAQQKAQSGTDDSDVEGCDFEDRPTKEDDAGKESSILCDLKAETAECDLSPSQTIAYQWKRHFHSISHSNRTPPEITTACTLALNLLNSPSTPLSSSNLSTHLFSIPDAAWTGLRSTQIRL